MHVQAMETTTHSTVNKMIYRIVGNVCGNNILRFTEEKKVYGFNVCVLILTVHINYMR